MLLTVDHALRCPAGSLKLHSMTALPPELLAPAAGTPLAPSASWQAHLALLRSFPGPLASNTSKDKASGE